VIEGLFRAGYDGPALDLLGKLIAASFVDVAGRPRPIAPEYWNEKAQPWGAAECAWQGLINDLLLSRVVGLQPDVPAQTLTIQPHIPDHLDNISAAIPLAGHWTRVAHTVTRGEGLVMTTTVENAALPVVVLRTKVPEGMVLASVELDEQEATADIDGAFAVLTIRDKSSFRVAAHYRTA